MRYQGSEAYNMSATEVRRERTQVEQRPSFEVVTGGGLDARARAGVSPRFVARVRAVVAPAAVLVVLGMARVAITSATVALLTSNASLSEQISEAQTLNEQLRIERSVLSSNARISRIATQNYGMVLSSEFVTLDLSASAEGEAGDQGQQSADGDAAQSADAGAEQSNLS